VADVVVTETFRFAREAALAIARAIERALRERGEASIALSGGPSTGAVYGELAALQLAWTEVEIYFADERCVPSEHPASHFGVFADRLLPSPRVAAAGLHRIEAERPDHARVAEEYERELPERLDLAVLEIGLDGHLAGLFPGSPALDERERRALAVETVQKPRHRITLTPVALRAARSLIVIASGRDRAEVIRRALREPGDARELPARIALSGTWILDRAAASRLGS
jgi:6-phosphogluconolactonase